MLHTWQRADISDNPTYGGDFARALGAIEARAIVMPVSTDLYFPLEDSRREVARMARVELRVVDSLWGHVAAGPDRNRAATAEISLGEGVALGGGPFSDAAPHGSQTTRRCALRVPGVEHSAPTVAAGMARARRSPPDS